MARVLTTTAAGGGQGLSVVTTPAAGTPRQSFSLPALRGGSGALSSGLARFAAEMEAAEREAQKLTNDALLLEAQRRMGQWMVDSEAQFKDPERGVLGRHANTDWVRKASEGFNSFASGMFSEQHFGQLDTQGQLALRQWAQGQALSFRSKLQAHRLQQQRAAVQSETKANMQLLRDEVARDPANAQGKLQQIARFVADLHHRLGTTDDAVVEADIQSELTTAVQLTTENLVNARQFGLARQFLAANRTLKVPGLGDVSMLADTRQDLHAVIGKAEEAEAQRQRTEARARRDDLKHWRSENLRRLLIGASNGHRASPVDYAKMDDREKAAHDAAYVNWTQRQANPNLVSDSETWQAARRMTSRDLASMPSADFDDLTAQLSRADAETMEARRLAAMEALESTVDASEAALARERASAAVQERAANLKRVEDLVKSFYGAVDAADEEAAIAAATLASEAALEAWQAKNPDKYMSRQELRSLVADTIRSPGNAAGIARDPGDVAGLDLTPELRQYIDETSAGKEFKQAYEESGLRVPQSQALRVYRDYYGIDRDSKGLLVNDAEFDADKFKGLLARMADQALPIGLEKEIRMGFIEQGVFTPTQQQIREAAKSLVFDPQGGTSVLHRWLGTAKP